MNFNLFGLLLNIQTGNDKAAESLIKGGANLDIVDGDGYTALHFAVMRGTV